MILIDQDTDNKLVSALERLRENPGATRCVYFKLMNSQLANAEIKSKVIDATNFYITSNDAQVYLCEDGDIFILAPTLAVKDARRLMLDVSSFAKRETGDDFVELFEVALQANRLLFIVEEKIEKRRRAVADLEKKREQEKAERKRQTILNSTANNQSTDIISRRKERSAPELMMIEDDTFSSRLVENVLQKKYPIKTLATADQALSTYAKIAPDLLFLDINLPDVTGHELLEKIISLDPEAYVIMLSGNADKENITQTMSKGAKGFIAKPFTREKLFQYIDRCPTISQ